MPRISLKSKYQSFKKMIRISVKSKCINYEDSKIKCIK